MLIPRRPAFLEIFVVRFVYKLTLLGVIETEGLHMKEERVLQLK